MEARDYQIKFINDIHKATMNHRSVCCVLPTGGGKTVCFAQIGQRVIANGGTVHFLAHREEIVDQISEKLSHYGIHHGRIQSGRSQMKAHAQVGMIVTYKNRLFFTEPPSLLVIDECHHTPASQYGAIIQAMPPTTTILGFTATPERLDGKGLDKYYEELVIGATTPELISEGYLVPPEVYAPDLINTEDLRTKYGDFEKPQIEEFLDRPAIIGDVVYWYKKLANDSRGVAFCVSIKHAEHVAESFRAAGIASAHIDGKMDKAKRRTVLHKFRTGEIKVLTSADLISEGFDLPLIETAILLRPTKSLGLYLQQVGRALRPAPGKERALILDHVQNTRRHLAPDIARDWSLEGAKSRKTQPKELQVYTCPACYLCYSGKMCPKCKVEDLRPGRQIEHLDGELVKVVTPRQWINKDEIELLWRCENFEQITEFCASNNVELESAKRLLMKRARTYEDLQRVGELLRYKPGWADHRWQATGANWGGRRA